MQKEKTPKGNQKIALERIWRLFELAAENEKYQKRYLQLAQSISTKTRTKIPLELKQKYCRKCKSMKVKQEKKGVFLIVKCEECGHERKYGAKEKAKK